MTFRAVSPSKPESLGERSRIGTAIGVQARCPKAYRAAEIFKEPSHGHRRVMFRVTLGAHHPLLGRPFFGRLAWRSGTDRPSLPMGGEEG